MYIKTKQNKTTHKTKQNIQQSPLYPSMEVGVKVARCSQEQALPRHRITEKRLKRCLVEVSGSEGLVLWPKALPIERIIWMVSLAGLPMSPLIGPIRYVTRAFGRVKGHTCAEGGRAWERGQREGT